MWQKVLHFDCRSKIRGSIPPYLLSLCWPRKCQPQIFVWFFFYFLLILISSMVEQDTSNIQIQVRVLDRNIYSYIQIKNNKLIQKKKLFRLYLQQSVSVCSAQRALCFKTFFSSIYQSRKVPNTLEKKKYIQRHIFYYCIIFILMCNNPQNLVTHFTQ